MSSAKAAMSISRAGFFNINLVVVFRRRQSLLQQAVDSVVRAGCRNEFVCSSTQSQI